MPTARISYAQLMQFHQNYVASKWPILSGGISKDDSKTVWFELNQELRDSLSAILDDGAVTGIRFYLIAYPNDYASDRGKEKRLSMGYVATVLENGVNADAPQTHPPMNHEDLSP